MRKVEQSRRFRRDFKREGRGIYRPLLEPFSGELWKVVETLANDIPLAPKYRDHPLHGTHEGSRECHIRPNLLLVYKYEGDYLILLEMLGSHSELFGM